MVHHVRVRKQTKNYGDGINVDEKTLRLILKPIQPDRELIIAQKEEAARAKEAQREKHREAQQETQRVKEANRQKILRDKEDRELMKIARIEEEHRARSDPKLWGSHTRDRVLRAFNMYGFGRWERMTNIDGFGGTRDSRAIEDFARLYVLQCGLIASEQELTKQDSDFVKEAINSAKYLGAMVQSGQRTLEMPQSLLEEKFIVKMKGGLAKKSLNKLDALAKLAHLMQTLCVMVFKARGEEINPGMNIDELVAACTIQELTQCMPFGDVRPGWSRPCTWWDLECDAHLVIGVFKHGYSRFDLVKEDPQLVFYRLLSGHSKTVDIFNVNSNGNSGSSSNGVEAGMMEVEGVVGVVGVEGVEGGVALDEPTAIDLCDRDQTDDDLGGMVQFDDTGAVPFALPDSRALNRLFCWLVSSEDARARQSDEVVKEKTSRKGTRSSGSKETSASKKDASFFNEHRSFNEDVYSILDMEAVALVYKVQGLKKCETIMEACLQNPASPYSPPESPESVPMEQEQGQEQGQGEGEGEGEECSEAQTAVSLAATTPVPMKSEFNCEEATRLSCALILYGAPPLLPHVPYDPSEYMPNQAMTAAMGTPLQFGHAYTTEGSSLSWSTIIARCNIEKSPEEIESFYHSIWKPFCSSLAQSQMPQTMNLSSHNKGAQDLTMIPNPLEPLAEHHASTKGLCQIFLVREHLMSVATFVLTKYFAELLEYLKSPRGRNVDSVPAWWCPWIHDVGLLIGLHRHGYLSLTNLVQDDSLPFTQEYLNKHIRQVFMYGSAIMPPVAEGEVHGSDAEGFVRTLLQQFPEYMELELRVMRILGDITRLLSQDEKAFPVVRCYPMFKPCLSSSGQHTPSLADLDKERDSGNSLIGAKNGEATGDGMKGPSLPLQRFMRETAKRRRMSLVSEGLEQAYSTLHV